jgi:hypothetical protein
VALIHLAALMQPDRTAGVEGGGWSGGGLDPGGDGCRACAMSISGVDSPRFLWEKHTFISYLVFIIFDNTVDIPRLRLPNPYHFNRTSSDVMKVQSILVSLALLAPVLANQLQPRDTFTTSKPSHLQRISRLVVR